VANIVAYFLRCSRQNFLTVKIGTATILTIPIPKTASLTAVKAAVKRPPIIAPKRSNGAAVMIISQNIPISAIPVFGFIRDIKNLRNLAFLILTSSESNNVFTFFKLDAFKQFLMFFAC